MMISLSGVFHRRHICKSAVTAFWILVFVGILHCSPRAHASTPATSPSLNDQFLWEGRFDQCSFNAVSSVLAYYREPHALIKDRASLEKQLFNAPLDQSGYGAYFGWGPWTSYMVNSGLMIWNGAPVKDLAAERFSLCTKAMSVFENNKIIVKYEKGEREKLCTKLINELVRGPVVLWTPYAGTMDVAQRITPWHHVTQLNELTDAVSVGNFTHSVTLFLKPSHAILVTDCSILHGVVITDASTIVATSAAMVAMVNRPDENGKSIFDKGLKGIQNNEFNVVFYRANAATRPSANSQTPKAASSQADAATPSWDIMLHGLSSDQLQYATFIYEHLPQRDVQEINPGMIRSAVAHATRARNMFPWGKTYPDEIFDQSVLPLFNLSETRESWWENLGNICQPIVRGCNSASEAALKLNAELFKKVNVAYHPTKRPRPDQSPSESIAAGYASCTGLSILLVDACRSVGIPARVVGTPAWYTGIGDSNGNHAGNHTWVEIWDQQWHVIGATEVSKLDQTWFLDNAARQLPAASNPQYKIYAAAYGTGVDFFPMVWCPGSTYISAEDVTRSYSNRTPVLIETDQPGHLTLHQSGRIIADLSIGPKPIELILCPGQPYDAVLTYDSDQDHPGHHTLTIPPSPGAVRSILKIKN